MLGRVFEASHTTPFPSANGFFPPSPPIRNAKPAARVEKHMPLAFLVPGQVNIVDPFLD